MPPNRTVTCKHTFGRYHCHRWLMSSNASIFLVLFFLNLMRNWDAQFCKHFVLRWEKIRHEFRWIEGGLFSALISLVSLWLQWQWKRMRLFFAFWMQIYAKISLFREHCMALVSLLTSWWWHGDEHAQTSQWDWKNYRFSTGCFSKWILFDFGFYICWN